MLRLLAFAPQGRRRRRRDPRWRRICCPRAALLIGLALAASACAGTSGVTTAARTRGGRTLQAAASRAHLPRVLLIGDSITAGYAPTVKRLLRMRADVVSIHENGGATSYGVVRLRHWLGSGRWDVIHFNFGLHDIDLLRTGGHLVPPTTYERNLELLVQRMRATGARLIWATTTPVPPGPQWPPRRTADVLLYNTIALRVMRANHVAIDDLYRLVLPQEQRLQVPHDVHYTRSGWDALGTQVARSIATALEPSR